MLINTWKHWFWITCPICQVLIMLTLQVSGMRAADEDVPPTAANASMGVELRPSPPSPHQISDVMSDTRSADTDDTVNGRNLDIFPIFPINKIHGKLYVDRTTGKKYKIKPKTEDTGEKTVNIYQDDYKVSIARLLSTTYSPPFADDNITDSSINATEEELKDEASPSPPPTDLNTTAGDLVVTTANSLLADNSVAAAPSVDEQPLANNLEAGAITGIALAIIVVSGLLGTISFVLYRRRYVNKPQVLNDKSSTLDSSGYIDDASLRENSEEMYSLDNDSFLNSLEAMTIQNYWTENVKHTKL